MTAAKVVIGAGYGDEGKGLLTDYLSSKYAADVVVRFNGGCQAGHTVETPAGERRVFGHISAGTFTGASTYLSQFFVINPFAFCKEMADLHGMLRSVPDIYVNPNAPVTTPYDMLINQLIEQHRGSVRHGSCGMGFGETIQRTEHAEDSMVLYYGHLADPDETAKIVKQIRDVWFPHRCKELGIDPSLGRDVIGNENIFKNFLAESQDMFHDCFMEDTEWLGDANQLVFEGAQGLMLDMDYGAFPHVTRSNTGMKNVETILDELDMDEVEVTYATRCYVTRHGAGPLSNELQGKPYKDVYDETNITNKYQGSLRFAYLDLDVLRKAIKNDIAQTGKINRFLQAKYNLAITCMDQADGQVKVYEGGRLETITSDIYGDFGDVIHGRIGFDCGLIKSYGPTRATIQERE